MSDEKKGGKAFKIIIIVILVIIIVGAGAFAGYYFMFGRNNKGNVRTGQVPANAVQANVSSRTYNLGEFLVNLADAGGKNYIKVTIYVGYENKKLDSELSQKQPIIRDAVNSVLRSKQTKDFTSKGTEEIKTQILNKINPILTAGKVDNIYFYDILVQ